MQLVRSLQSARHQRAIRQHRDVLARTHHLRLAERNCVLRPRINPAPKSLAIQPFVLEKQHRIVTSNRCPQQSQRILRIRRHDHQHTWRVRKDALARLRVIDRPAGQIPTNRHANDHRAAPRPIRAPAQQRKLIAHLVHRRPDVIEELNLDNRFQPAHGHADRAAHDVRFSQRRIKAAVGPELRLQPRCQLEDSAFALDLAGSQRLVARRIGNVFPEDEDALVPPHLVLQAQVDQLRHRALARVGGRLRLGLPARIRRLQLFGVDMQRNRLRLRQHRLYGAIRCTLHLFVNLALQSVDAVRVEDSLT